MSFYLSGNFATRSIDMNGTFRVIINFTVQCFNYFVVLDNNSQWVWVVEKITFKTVTHIQTNTNIIMKN